MKNKSVFFDIRIIFMLAGILLVTACQKDEVKLKFNPSVTYGSVTDIDGNTYKTVTIGDQTWMAENLRTSHYNDGSEIPLVTVDTLWGKLTTAGFCWYSNNPSKYKSVYGALYNWYAVTNDSLDIAPEGWHVPTDADWVVLETYLGAGVLTDGRLTGGAFLKSKEGWNSPNLGADNSSGFTGMPVGFRDNQTGLFHNVDRYAFWWSATNSGASNAWYRGLGFDYANINRWAYNKNHGMSVRCIQN